MKYLIYDLSTLDFGRRLLFRYTGQGRDAERWDPASMKWICGPAWKPHSPENMVEAEIRRGSYGMRTPDLAEVAAITGGALDPMTHSEAPVSHVCECGDRFAERRLLEAHLSVANLMRGTHAAVPNPDSEIQEA
jgi:hypothetical protein